jgi:hypothetical protein
MKLNGLINVIKVSVLNPRYISFLNEERVNKQREFFRVTLEEAKSIIEKIGRKYI